MTGLGLAAAHAAAFGLPLPTSPVTLGEGHTPLLPSVRIGPEAGLARLFFKVDSLNPTGSYKDRFCSFQVNAMLARGQRVCLATSSGNTGSSLAAYAARAGIQVVLCINEITPAGKLTQMAAHGARLLRVAGFGSDPAASAAIFARLQELAATTNTPLVISAFCFCPEAMRGVSTMSYEILDQLGEAPAVCYAPVGGGGLFTAVARGFADRAASVRLEPVQPAGNDTAITPLRQGLSHAVPLAGGAGTSISGLSVPTVLDGDEVVRLAQASGGSGELVDEATVREVQADLYRLEGLAVEPAGAVAVAGALQARRDGRLRGDQTVVAILTGQGFKDPEREQAIAARQPVRDVGVDDLTAAILGPSPS